MKPLCIYHGHCDDGFAAAWCVRKALGTEVDFYPGVYQKEPPPHEGRDVIFVDFSYKRPVLDAMAAKTRSMLILDHHKTAQEDLADVPKAPDWEQWQVWDDPLLFNVGAWRRGAVFDMNRSGAGLAWDFLFPNQPRPKLIDHIEDRDLWRFNLPNTREIQATVFSHPYDFPVWDNLIEAAESHVGVSRLTAEGSAIDRKMLKDIAELLGVATRHMVIGGVEVPVVNLPYTMASEAAGTLAAEAPFAASYFDNATHRVFSLRSRGEGGADVSAIAKAYGGGGHRNAAGFQMPIGWEGDK